MSETATATPDSLVILGGDLNDSVGSEPINALEKDGLLVRVAKDKTPDEQATYTFAGKKEAIDHLFVGKGQASRYVAGSATVYCEGKGFGGSDHCALEADFKVE